MIFNKHTPSARALLGLIVILFVFAQILFTYLHFRLAGLIDTIGNSNIIMQVWDPVIFLPLLSFVVLQLLAYGVVIAWLWFIMQAYRDLFHLTPMGTALRSILLGLLACAGILIINTYLYPHSFFALRQLNTSRWHAGAILTLAITLLFFFATLLGCVNFFLYRRRSTSGYIVLTCLGLTGFASLLNSWHSLTFSQAAPTQQPNIIFIGLDSVRPDFLSYFNKQRAHTPTIDSFLEKSVVLTQAYTPLARTFPSWMSILTSMHPVHSQARNNLVEASDVIPNDTLAKKLRAAGYQTLYASDEKRFSNISQDYGFDHVIGPKMGANDFLLGTFADLPLTNILINLPFGRFLFPYNYGNRAAAITYAPASFVQLLKSQIPQQSQQPLFLAIHFCLSHWPYTWARDKEPEHLSNMDRYIASIEGVDRELQATLAVLKAKGLLQHAIVVLLSDHGTALGLIGDRVISEKHFLGDKKQLAPILRYQLQGTNTYDLNTAYGQGTDVLSLQQYHILLAFRGFGVPTTPKAINTPSSALNIAPTILAQLNLPAFKKSDGVPMPAIWQASKNAPAAWAHATPQFWETGDKLGAIETDKINVQKVLEARISMYDIDPKTGLLFLRPVYERSLIENKQRAVWLGDWMLVRFPPRIQMTLKPQKTNSKTITLQPTDIPLQYVLVNLKTGQWAIGLHSALAKRAPTQALYQSLRTFYPHEI